MRTIKELLEITLDNIDKIDGKYISGLCFLSAKLCSLKIISVTERYALFAYIQENRPSIFSSWSAFKSRNHSHYWPKYKVEPRIKWLKKHIKLNS